MSNFFLLFIYHINKQIGIKIIKLKEYFGDTLIKWLVSICLQLKSELVPLAFLIAQITQSYLLSHWFELLLSANFDLYSFGQFWRQRVVHPLCCYAGHQPFFFIFHIISIII